MAGALRLTRREAALLALGLAAPTSAMAAAGPGRLQARPRPAPNLPAPKPGLHALNLARRDAYLYVPPLHKLDVAAPLIVMLHGATFDGRASIAPWKDAADARGFLVLAPSSRERTWDLRGTATEDIAFIDRALTWTFERTLIDASHIALAGFSDGASFALTLGLANGDVFRHVFCFSAGMLHLIGTTGKPELFFSHGREDPILSINNARKIAAYLEDRGYDVAFHQFSGGHRVSESGVAAALVRFLG